MAFRPNRSGSGDDNRKGRREGGFNSGPRNTGRPAGAGGSDDRKPFGKRSGDGERGDRPQRSDNESRPSFNRDRGGERRPFNNDRPDRDRPFRGENSRNDEGGYRRESSDRRDFGGRGTDRNDRPGYRRDDSRGERPSFRRNDEQGGSRDDSRGGYRDNNRSDSRGGYRENRRPDEQGGFRRDDRPGNRDGGRFDRREEGRASGGDRYNDRREGGRGFESRGGENRYGGGRYDDRGSNRGDDRGGRGRSDDGRRDDRAPRSYSDDRRRNNESYGERRSRNTDGGPRREAPRYRDDRGNDHGEGRDRKPQPQSPAGSNELMTLNKYLAHCGVSSRRDAAGIVKEGKVSVNGEVLTTPGYRVKPEDVVTMDGKTLTPQRHHVYILLNKPKDYLTTTEDDRGRRTVLDLVEDADAGRLYPVGRLDRDTTGVLLLTNDGDFAQRLSHPKYEVKKVYQVTLDREVSKKDFDAIITGVELEDGVAVVDELAYLENKNEIGLQIHSGRNRIVRRIFEQLGYTVEKLDRVMYAGLTKKNVSRGKWRFLTEREVVLLKHFKTQ